MAASRKVGRVVLWILVLLAAGLVVGAILRRDGGAESEPYRTEAVDRGDVAMTVTATGTVSPVVNVQVGSQVSGIIARLHADYNSEVRRGQLLAELDPTPFEAQVEQRRADLTRAEVELRNAEIQYRRLDRLFSDGLTSQSELDAARAAFEAARAGVDQARAALRQAETNLRYTKIVSPIDGVVVARQYDVGQTVAASFQAPTLFTIARDLTRMQVQADVDQADIGRIRVGQVARFTVDAYPEETFEGRIAQVRLNATANQTVITYPVIVEVDNPGGKLRPQMTATVTIEVDRARDVLRVPNAALRFRPAQPGAAAGAAASSRAGARQTESFERALASAAPRPGSSAAVARQADSVLGRRPNRGREQTVHVLRDGGRLEPVPVRTGVTDGRYTAILEGALKPGDRVVVGLATAKADQSGSQPFGGRRWW